MTGQKALTLIEDHHVARGMPLALEMHEIRTAMEAQEDTRTDPAILAHDMLTDQGRSRWWTA